MSVTQSPPSPDTGKDLTFLQELTSGFTGDFAVRFWDGSVWNSNPEQAPRFTLVLNHAGAVRQMFWPFNPIGLGEAYIYDDFDIEGDIFAFFAWVRFLVRLKLTLGKKVRYFFHLWGRPNTPRPRLGRQPAQLSGTQRSPQRDRQAIQYHYDDLPSEFFALFLDKYMQYTCGYFKQPHDDIDTAQEQKLDLICKKLRLKPGERLIDFGCGWGALILHAAKNYGVEAVGVSLSKAQIAWANERIRQAGLQDRCRADFCDYRQVPEPQSTSPSGGESSRGSYFDKAVSVGFIEHLGEKMMPVFFGKVWRLLRPRGLYLHHAITLKPNSPYPPWTAFARKYVFPDGEIRPITNTLVRLAEAGFEIRDVESLREHYILTLQHWVRKLEDHHEQVRNLTDEVNYRVFRIYMAGAALGFQSGSYNIYQTLTCKSEDDVTGLPLTRADWFV